MRLMEFHGSDDIWTMVFLQICNKVWGHLSKVKLSPLLCTANKNMCPAWRLLRRRAICGRYGFSNVGVQIPSLQDANAWVNMLRNCRSSIETWIWTALVERHVRVLQLRLQFPSDHALVAVVSTLACPHLQHWHFGTRPQIFLKLTTTLLSMIFHALFFIETIWDWNSVRPGSCAAGSSLGKLWTVRALELMWWRK